jgi:CDP-diacylglycerol---glycerol-3-phosphate 3-phosphatidyltransferase
VATNMDAKFQPSALVTPANAITAVRLLATLPVVILIVERGVSWAATLAWAAVACTDFLDGWVARRQGATTSWAFLDPLADKVLVLGALVALVASGLAPWIPVALIAGREVAVSVYRSVVGRSGISVPARPLAKCKTASQDLAVGFILLPATRLHHAGIGQTLLWLSAGLALVSGAQYLLDSRRTAPAALAAAGDDQPPA